MKKRSEIDAPAALDDLRAKVLGLGERSARRSYYPMLRAQLADLSRFRAALDGSNDAIFLVAAAAGTIEDCNQAACRMLGRPQEALVGRPLGDALPALAEEVASAANAAEGRRASLTTTIRAAGAAEIPVEVTLSFVRVGRDPYAIAVARDVSERRRAQQALRLLADATATLASSLDLATTLANVAAVGLPYLGDVCAVYRRSPEGAIERLALDRTDAIDAVALRRLEAVTACGEEIGVGRAVRTGRAEIVPEGVGAARALGVGSLLVAPFSAGAATAGALLFAARIGGRPHDDLDRDVAAQLGQRLAMALENVRLYGEAQAAAQRAEESLAQLDTLLVSAPVGIAFVDRDLRYLRVNATLAELHGIPPEETVGRTLHEIIPDLAPIVAQRVRAVLRTGEPILHREEAHSFPAAPGSTHWLVSYYPVRTPSGALLGAGVIVLDITERKRAEAERELLLDRERAARAEAERASRLKDDFVATVSHELRTPLHAILGWTQLARRPASTPEQTSKGLAVIEGNARVLEQLVSDLLDVSRIGAGKLQLERAPVALRGVVHAAVDALRASAEAKGVSLHESAAADRDVVLGDPNRLQQVVSNLVSNAVKFTPRGGRVDVALTRSADQAVLVVRDTGQGIEPDFLPHVFDRFRQADASKARRHGGLGLGLTIVRQVVALHGGTVGAESAGCGQGACFTVTLPLAERRAGARPRDGDTEVPVASLEGVRVLVVEDEPDALELVERILVEQGAEVATAATAPVALASLAARVPDVMLSDIGLPGMLAGFQEHLCKPLDVSALMAVLARFARAGERQQARE
jgi:PAS domain S-box-containing protein